MQTVIVHYASEVTLKGANRKDFENALIRNIKKSLGNNIQSVDKPYGRVAIQIKNKKNTADKLKKIFGISWFAFAETCDNDIEKIKKLALKHKIKAKTFYVKTKRADKRFPLKSTDVSREVGKALAEKYDSQPNFNNAEEKINIEITEKGTYIFTEKIKGLGGLPVGTSGKVLVLMSGGIDSPVATYLIMKRGCSVDYLHFHALKSNSDAKNSKISKIIDKLKEYNNLNSKLYLMAHHEFDLASQSAPSEFHLILFRRYMFKVAEKLAERIGAKAIVTGDNLAQVASQTLENLSNADRSVQIPVFRPLLTYDKQEIIDLAKKIDTYNISLQPYKDCCAIISKKPKTKPKLEKVEKYEKLIDQDNLVKETVNKF